MDALLSHTALTPNENDLHGILGDATWKNEVYDHGNASITSAEGVQYKGIDIQI